LAEKRVILFRVYVLKSLSTGNYYTGYTEDLDARLKKHNSGSVRSTKAYRPFVVVYSEIFDNKASARKRELFLKSGQGRKFLKAILE